MSEIVLTRDVRLALRAQAHHLDPVVLLGSNGLTEAVMKEIDRELTAHELIKVRVPSDDREERAEIFEKVADALGAARVQMIGKLLVLWRPQQDEEVPETLDALMRAHAEKTSPKAQEPKTKKKVASKKPGEKKTRKEAAPRRRLRPKRKRTTKKAALSS